MDLTRIDPWLFIAGLGFFLYGMQRLVAGLEAVSGKVLEQTLRRFTRNPLSSILVGTGATAVLQSSSLVGVMVLAFVGAGVLQMRNAVGVILGANLGTTVTGWLVTAIGFKLNLDEVAIPLLALGTLGVVFTEGRRSEGYATLALGLGLLLFGLGFMKESVEAFTNSMDISRFAGAPILGFFLIGFIVAAIIRSSSATMMMTLSALSVGSIDLTAAAAIAVGADLGTTSTVMLASVRGSAATRQVALAHFLFNVMTAVLAMLVLLPFLERGLAMAGISDPLYGLVAFHSFFNVAGIVLFFPFIPPFANFLERRFRREARGVSRYLAATPPGVASAATEALEKEVAYRLNSTLVLNAHAFDREAFKNGLDRLRYPPAESYAHMKQAEGEAIDYARAVLALGPGEDASARVTQLLDALRDGVYAAKCINDIRPDLHEFQRIGSSTIDGYQARLRAHQRAFYTGLNRALRGDPDELGVLENGNAEFHRSMVEAFYRHEAEARLTDIQTSTFLNILRETDAANRALLRAAAAMLGDPDSDMAVLVAGDEGGKSSPNADADTAAK